MSAATCPKCQHAMEEGFLLDRGHGNIASTAEWLEGAPEKSFWIGVKTRDRERLPVRTFRCTGCGYLESYARDG